MKSVNLFPYRHIQQRHRILQFQRGLFVTLSASLMMATLMLWSLSQDAFGLMNLTNRGLNATTFTLNAEQRALIESMYRQSQSVQAQQNEQRQRLVVFEVIHAMAKNTMPGVSIQHLKWSEGVLHVQAWIQSQEHAQDWIQELQAIPGVMGIEKDVGPPDPLAIELAMQVLLLQLKVQVDDAQ